MKGCVVYEVFYPMPINVELGESNFKLDGEFFFIGVSSHQRALNTMSFPNTISKGAVKYEFENPVEPHSNQTFCYSPPIKGQFPTGFLMSTEAGKTNFNYLNTLTTIKVAFEADSEEKTIEKALRALNHFIQVYRYVSKDMGVKETDFVTGLHPYLVGGFKTYTLLELKKKSAMQRIEELYDDGWKLKPNIFHTLQKPLEAKFDSKRISQEIAHYLVNDRFYPWMQTMNRSYELSLIQHHHNAAIIEAFLSVELRIFEYVPENGIRVRFNKRKQDSPTVFDVIKTLKKFLGNNLHSDLHKFRVLRNNIVHKGYKSTHEDCVTSLQTAVAAHTLIDKST
ncbi:hypothetical protein [Vibrio splendidus]|uniref:hypothetical protein n=1 Tax=Vibrio splendidus TaxID=29497 RepID=UPI000E094883|nr:hypothetical protein [Vibrio splendidus]